MSWLQAGKFGVQIPAGATHLPLNQHDIVSLTQFHILKNVTYFGLNNPSLG
jgi:hypothetical protein